MKKINGGILINNTVLVVCTFLFFSCETVGGTLGDFFSFLQSGSTDSSTGSTATKGTPVNTTQSAEKSANKRSDPDSANWEIEKLDTAKDAEYLSAIEKDVVLEMNKVRSDPKKYAELYIQTELRYYNGNIYQKPGQTAIQTNEGKTAVEGCVNALSKMKAVPILNPEPGLSLGAKDHATDQARTGGTGHDGSDRSTPFTRIKRYGKGYTHAGENLSYGANSGRNIVVQLLIDDGIPSRGHRANIMNKNFIQTGVSCGAHPKFRTMCATTFAAGYVSN